MSYIVFFLLITSRYIFGAPILEESLQYRFIECISGDNDTLSKQIVELTNINETCVRVNKSSASNNESYKYIVPEAETTLEIQITIESCSTPLTKLYLSLCNDQTDYNNTEVMVTFPYTNISSIDKIDENENKNTSTSETTVFTTDSTAYETTTNINHDSDEDGININHKPSYNFDKVIESSDSDSEEDDSFKINY
ncbi:unnamed protein product [Rotaria socialis]|uniref:Uncharacterized protein n=1 Tax=Rotaria socialis TaxID=392032 RepID=A0A819ACB3_9BILA|nr:unnamed protein product [Rotaria socialis]CAF3783378.1 unnamed protein product [Rotaria socialis]CAF4253410.1 unnamed protein product [Rotaria socialis]CAF4675026.1 unnamed protein product [Rotaria socialis]